MTCSIWLSFLFCDRIFCYDNGFFAYWKVVFYAGLMSFKYWFFGVIEKCQPLFRLKLTFLRSQKIVMENVVVENIAIEHMAVKNIVIKNAALRVGVKNSSVLDNVLATL
ncbi:MULTISPECIES: hypothetical protein [unclassified Halomonas]|uniref:hypothetical protein n=1 Tax=unclassified Halomonas TaxID=2609666 RepID=UPI0009909475|nr:MULTISPECIES: hypothetical protein [unclassified Halomonas]AQU83869.1 hypothetical protein B2G49_15560 [Halomonas sp. 'Soap Lake \